jgi:hypothetical protein
MNQGYCRDKCKQNDGLAIEGQNQNRKQLYIAHSYVESKKDRNHQQAGQKNIGSWQTIEEERNKHQARKYF